MENPFDLINKAELARRLGVSRELVSRWFRSNPPKVPDDWVDAVASHTGLPKSLLRGRAA